LIFFNGFVLRIPIDTPTGEPVVAEVTQSGSRKDAVVACALQACRVLDRHGLLRKSTHGMSELIFLNFWIICHCMSAQAAVSGKLSVMTTISVTLCPKIDIKFTNLAKYSTLC
jgi:hypothetical protein